MSENPPLSHPFFFFLQFFFLQLKFMTASCPTAFCALSLLMSVTFLRPRQNSLNMAVSAAVSGCERTPWQLSWSRDWFGSSGQTNIGRKGLWDGQAEQTTHESDVWLDRTFSSNVRVSRVSRPLWSFRRWQIFWGADGIRRTDWHVSLFLWLIGLQTQQIKVKLFVELFLCVSLCLWLYWEVHALLWKITAFTKLHKWYLKLRQHEVTDD